MLTFSFKEGVVPTGPIQQLQVGHMCRLDSTLPGSPPPPPAPADRMFLLASYNIEK